MIPCILSCLLLGGTDGDLRGRERRPAWHGQIRGTCGGHYPGNRGIPYDLAAYRIPPAADLRMADERVCGILGIHRRSAVCHLHASHEKFLILQRDLK